jgi:hypothetical protein
MPEFSLPKLEEENTCWKRTNIEHIQGNGTEYQLTGLSDLPPHRIPGISQSVAQS